MINSLNVAQTGLSAAKVSVENVMNNISNANTEGYKKRVTETSELEHLDSRVTGRGVTLGDTVRTTSQYLYDNILKENTKESYQEEMSLMLGTIESVFQETDDSGLSAELDRYFQTIESLRANPNNEIYKNELVISGNNLVTELNRLYDSIDNQESTFNQSLTTSVKDINIKLQDIADINKKIAQNGESNDLLDKRDLLEKELSEYTNISVDRDSDVYQLKIGSEVAVRNGTAYDLSVNEEYISQVDRYVTDDGQSNILASSDIFDEEDVITVEINNNTSVSVEYGETMYFDLDSDGTEEVVTVDETNYIRALVNKINTSTDMTSQVSAYNGNYGINDEGEKYTIDASDQFLVIESDVTGVDGKFDSRISFVEEAYSEISTSTEITPALLNQELTINSEYSATGQSVTHTINLGSAISGSSQSYDIDLSNSMEIDGTTYSTSGSISFIPSTVTFTQGAGDPLTGTISVPVGVDSFTIEVDSISGATGSLRTVDDSDESSLLTIVGQEQNYNLSLTRASGAQTGKISSLLTVVDDGKDAIQSYDISLESSGLGSLESAIATTNPHTGEEQASGTTQISSVNSSVTKDGKTISYEVTLAGTTTSAQVLDIEFSDNTGSYYDQTPVFIPSTISYDSTNGQITIPTGVNSFSFTVETNELVDVNTEQTYSFSITDNAAPAGRDARTNKTTITMTDVEGEIAKSIYKDDYQSTQPSTTVNLQMYDEAVVVSDGKLKAILDNLSSNNESNFNVYKEKLDAFAKTFVDMTSSYIKNAENDYVHGEIASDNDIRIADDIDLFSGSSVRTLEFNETRVRTLEQKDYDYLSTHQWKEDISFQGFGQDGLIIARDSEITSFSSFYQETRSDIARDKESVDFMLDTQKAVTESLQNTYDGITKVDTDEEMINLMKYQAAYTANAKMITVVDEMLSTLLGMT